MGTSTMGGDLHSDKQDKLLKLQARKRELEQMLASKNEELYRLCVQEVRLTGVVPPEAPLSPDVPRRDGIDVRDSTEPARRPRPERDARRALGRRLSTPPGAAARPPRRHDTGCSNFFPSPPQEPLVEPAPRREPRAPYHHPHFSASHPDIAACARPAPLLFQYAAQLRAQSGHLRRTDARRVLQRTQTYHLTAHSEHGATLPLPRAARPPLPPLRLHSPGYDVQSTGALSPSDGRAKEKLWYETSLDAPARAELRKSASLKRSPSVGAPQPCEPGFRSPCGPAALSPGAVSLESPQNLTVIEQGRCIPYREETKPFEMSDFYKYSTKFRQAATARPALPPAMPQYAPDQWHGYAN